MSLESDIANKFTFNEWLWHFKGNQWRIPSESDVRDALDEAARMLYDSPVGAQLEVGRLIIQKKTKGFDVFMFVGEYS